MNSPLIRSLLYFCVHVVQFYTSRESRQIKFYMHRDIRDENIKSLIKCVTNVWKIKINVLCDFSHAFKLFLCV